MNTTKFLASAASLLLTCAMVSCTEDNEPSSGMTHIYVSSSTGVTSIFQGAEGITLDITLSAPATEATTLKVTAEGDAAAALEFAPEYVTVAAGATTAQFTVTATGAVAEEATATITVSDFDSKKFDVKETLSLTVYPATGAYELNETELAMVEAFKQQYGVDLTPWLGYVDLKGTIEFPGGGSLEAFVEPTTIDLEGVSIFRINPASTPANLILDMTSNPMGMSEYLYSAFRNLTIDDKEIFAYEDEEYNGGNLSLMERLNWNSNSIEEFVVSLPGMTFDIDPATKKGSVNFIVEGDCNATDAEGNILEDQEGEPLTLNSTADRVNFNYFYTAWNRQVDLFLKKDPIVFEQTCYSVFSHPAAHLGLSNVLTNDWEEDIEGEGEESLYCEPKGTVDFEKGTMTFVFPFDHADQYGYSRVKVVYTIAK